MHTALLNARHNLRPAGISAWIFGFILMLSAFATLHAAETGASPAVEALPATSGEGAGNIPIDESPEPQPPSAALVTEQESETSRTLDENVRDLKREIIQLNRDLFILEEELLFPSSTQLAVFLSMDIGYFFKLDAVQLKIDNKEVANYLYTKREVDALARGGVQRLYIGNVKTGARELVATFVGYGPNGREYKRATTLTIEKGTGTKFVELKIADDTRKEQPDFAVREWE